jgi:excisionase family DNA binding protein
VTRRRGPHPAREAVAPEAPEPLRLADRLALRPEEAARALGVSERTLRRLAPRLPRIRDGGTVLYPVEALRRWLDEQARAEGAREARIAHEIVGAVERASNYG